MNAIQLALASLEELRAVVANTDASQAEAVQDMILGARRVFVAAAGRSLLAMKFFAMRLMQLGIQTYLVGEVCTPSIQPGDLLLIGSGSGETAGMLAIARKAKDIGAKLAVLTKKEDSSIARCADAVLRLNSADPIREGAAEAAMQNPDDYRSIRPSGNPFEQAIVVVADAMICSMMLKLGRGTAHIARNHANLE